MFLSKITGPLHFSSYHPLYVNSKYPSESFVDDSTTISIASPTLLLYTPESSVDGSFGSWMARHTINTV